MALLKMPSDYVYGFITLENGSEDFTGTGTAWQLVGLDEGDLLIDVEGAQQFWALIGEITSNTAGKLTQPWAGPDLTAVAYRMRFTSDGVRSTAQAAMLRQDLGNGRVQAITNAPGTVGVLEYLPGGGAQLVPKTDLVSGANYDVQVANLAARAAYDGQAAGFSVLVADVGDGRAAIYSKITNASGNWTSAAYVTGPVGPVSTVPGVVWRGTYAAGTTYAINDGVTFNGSSFRKLTTAAAGTAPSGASPPVNTAAWEVLASRGINGAGTVNSIVAGTNITVSNSDPTAPVVSLGPNAFTKANILGTVSQTSGVPTGAVVERGSNANGEYIRYADGTQICWRKVNYGAPTLTSASGSLFYSSPAPAQVMPVTFVGIPAISIQGWANKATWVASNGQPALNSWPGFYPFAEISGTAISYIADYIAVGRWF